MDNFISILRDASSPEELEQYKVQLFRENVRIKTDKSELEEMYDQLGIERKKLEETREEIENQESLSSTTQCWQEKTSVQPKLLIQYL